jgi:ribosome recycling factor
MNNGESVIINIPPLTEERRTQLAKQAKAESENAKISIRNHRKEAKDEVKVLEKNGLSEDLAKDTEEEIQNLVNKYYKIVEDLEKEKEAEIMTV